MFELEITEVVGFYLVSELYSCNENLLRFCSARQIFIKGLLLCVRPGLGPVLSVGAEEPLGGGRVAASESARLALCPSFGPRYLGDLEKSPPLSELISYIKWDSC